MTTCTPECDAEKAALVEAVKENAETFHATHAAEGEFETCMDVMCESNRAALADTSPAQGKETADIETLREMVHAFYEGGRPITKEQLDAFCAVGGEEKE